MSRTVTPFEHVLQLPAKERLAVAHAIWDSLVGDPISVPVPDWHADILAERIADDDGDTSPGESFADVRRRIEGGA